jgi:hypothetical protein
LVVFIISHLLGVSPKASVVCGLFVDHNRVDPTFEPFHLALPKAHAPFDNARAFPEIPEAPD